MFSVETTSRARMPVVNCAKILSGRNDELRRMRTRVRFACVACVFLIKQTGGRDFALLANHQPTNRALGGNYLSVCVRYLRENMKINSRLTSDIYTHTTAEIVNVCVLVGYEELQV